MKFSGDYKSSKDNQARNKAHSKKVATILIEKGQKLRWEKGKKRMKGNRPVPWGTFR